MEFNSGINDIMKKNLSWMVIKLWKDWGGGGNWQLLYAASLMLYNIMFKDDTGDTHTLRFLSIY